MKKWILMTVLMGAVSIAAHAQNDDMYFVPSKKKTEARTKSQQAVPSSTYYSGSWRSVDDYNRRGASTYEVLPADTGDIITFAGVEGAYPDSISDFQLTQQMARFDDYEPDVAYWQGYAEGLNSSWHSPWYYSSFYPWYDSYWYWNGPWGWHHGWYDPWYYDYWGWGWGGYYSWHYPSYYYGWGGYWGGPYYGGNHHVAHYPGTQNHGRIGGAGPRGTLSGRSHSYSAGTFGRGTSRSTGNYSGARSGSFSPSRTGATSTTRTRTTTSGTYSNSYGNFGGSRSSNSSSSSSSSRSYTPSSSGSSSGGSFGGSRSSGGGSFGGSRSGGGGGGSFGRGRR